MAFKPSLDFKVSVGNLYLLGQYCNSRISLSDEQLFQAFDLYGAAYHSIVSGDLWKIHLKVTPPNKYNMHLGC